MNTAFIYLVAFNILAIPFVIYTHIKGECTLLTQIFSGVQPYCGYINNPFANLLYLNVTFFILSLLIYANSQIPHYEGPPKRPQSNWKKRSK